MCISSTPTTELNIIIFNQITPLKTHHQRPGDTLMFCSPFRRRRRRRRRLEEVEERQLTREEAWHLYIAKECLNLLSFWS